ncbi:MAG TPA: hypothetical protein VGI56_05810 [Galbitalea sp.]
MTRVARARAVTLRVAAATVIALSGMALSGCAAPTTESHNGAGAHSPSAAASMTATPTPTPTPLAPPAARFPLTCDQLAPAATITSLLGAGAIPGNPVTGDTGGIDLAEFSLVQDGGIWCAWTNNATKDLLDTTHLSIHIVPDVTAATWAQFTPLEDGLVTTDFPGDSFTECEGSNHTPAYCSVNTLIGTTWVAIEASVEGLHTSGTAASLAHFKPEFSHVISAVQSATETQPAWSDPKAPAPKACTSTLTATQLAALLPGAKVQGGYGAPDAQAGVVWGPNPSTKMSSCEWDLVKGGSDNFVDVELLPSGVWAWPQLSAYAAQQPQHAVLSGLADRAMSFVVPFQGGATQVVVATSGEYLMLIEVSAQSASAAQALAIAKSVTGDLSAVLAQP